MIHYAAGLDFHEILVILHSLGVNMNQKSDCGYTALEVAIAKGFEKSVKKLMRLNANLVRKDDLDPQCSNQRDKNYN